MPPPPRDHVMAATEGPCDGLNPWLGQGHKTRTLRPPFGRKTKESSDQGFAIPAGGGLLGMMGVTLSPKSDVSHPGFPCRLPACWGIFFSQVFPNSREISRPTQTVTRGVCHRLQRNLPRGSVAMATGGRKKNNSDPARRLGR